MKRFVEGQDRDQLILLSECLDDYVGEDNPVRAVDAFIDELDLAALGFAGVVSEATGRPSYHPATLLKVYLYGYLNRIASSRRLERETQRNLELIWLTGRLMPDFKMIADFRKDNGAAIQATCRQFVLLCRELGLFTDAVVAIDGTPEPMLFPGDASDDFIQVPLIATARRSLTDAAGQIPPNLRSHCRIVSWVTEMPRAASISSTMRRLNGNRKYSHIA